MSPKYWHDQDWLLVVESIISSTGPDLDSMRDQRAWELIGDISGDLGLEVEECVQQVDRGWPLNNV